MKRCLVALISMMLITLTACSGVDQGDQTACDLVANASNELVESLRSYNSATGDEKEICDALGASSEFVPLGDE